MKSYRLWICENEIAGGPEHMVFGQNVGDGFIYLECNTCGWTGRVTEEQIEELRQPFYLWDDETGLRVECDW